MREKPKGVRASSPTSAATHRIRGRVAGSGMAGHCWPDPGAPSPPQGERVASGSSPRSDRQHSSPRTGSGDPRHNHSTHQLLFPAERLAVKGRPLPGAVRSSFSTPTGVPPRPACSLLLFLASTCGYNKSVLGCRALGGRGERERCDWLSRHRLPLRAHIS